MDIEQFLEGLVVLVGVPAGIARPAERRPGFQHLLGQGMVFGGERPAAPVQCPEHIPQFRGMERSRIFPGAVIIPRQVPQELVFIDGESEGIPARVPS